MQRELTALEHRLYKFLDDVDSITEGELTASKWDYFLVRLTLLQTLRIPLSMLPPQQPRQVPVE